MFTVYSKQGCPFCVKIEKVFQLKGFEYKKYMLGEDFDKTSFIEKFGSDATFPRVLDKDGELIGGAKETAVYLKNNGLV